MCACVLQLCGYTDVDPQAPLGGPDGKKDIIAWRDGKKYVAAVYFPPTPSSFAEIKRKYRADLHGVRGNDAAGFIFMTNQRLSPRERSILLELGASEVDQIFALERIRAVLDQPGGYGPRLEYLQIPIPVPGGGQTACSTAATGIAVSPTCTLPVIKRSPFDLGVHRAISLDGGTPEQDAAEILPPYVYREHDAIAAQLLSHVKGSLMLLFIGESSTGKSRSCLEVVTTRLPGWPLLHPLDAAELLAIIRTGVPAQTVLWLNETQIYLDGGHGPDVAVELRRLSTSDHGPVVVIGAMWSDYWQRFTEPPEPGEFDEHFQARMLLESHVRRLDVPASFRGIDEHERARLSHLASTDPRLAEALRASGPEMNVTQVLAGGPPLLDRYERVLDPLSRAAITAALHARTLGYRSRLTPGLLEAAVEGYVTARQRVAEPGWFSAALGKATQPVRGIRALEPSRTLAGVGAADDYEPHNYLLQHSKIHRQTPPPASLWDALDTNCADSDDRVRLASRASFHGLYRLAVHIAAPAAQANNTAAMQVIAVVLERARCQRGSLYWWRRAAEAGGAAEIEDLLDRLQRTGRFEEVERWERVLASMLPELPPVHEEDEEAALEALWSEAEDGNATSMEVLAGWLDMEGEYADAEHWWRTAAEAGNVEAMVELADRLNAQDQDDEADRWRERAEEHGYRPPPPLTEKRGRPSRPPSVLEQIAADCAREPEETVHRWRRIAQTGERRTMHELVYALQRANRAAEAKQVQRYGIEPGGMTAEPWDDRPYR
jgi:TPR repeat protein